MKKLLLINRILFLLSFLLPFFFFQMCGPSKKEAVMTQAKQDSINASVEAQIKADSVEMVNAKQSFADSNNSSANIAKQNLLKTSELPKKIKANKTAIVNEKKEDKIINKIWEHMLFPTKNSISALGLTVLTVQIEIGFFDYKKFKIKDLIAFLIPVNLLIALILLLLIIFKKIKLSRIFSIISLLFFIIAVFQYHEHGILWGFWVAFILNMIDLVLVNLILYKPAQE